MQVPVVFDCCAWDVLFENAVDLGEVLPVAQYRLSMPREVEIEIEAISDSGRTGPLKAFIRSALESRQIPTTGTFGFAEANPPGVPPVYVGFGQGGFASEEEVAYRARPTSIAHVVGKARPAKSGLAENQTDLTLAVTSMSAVVVTAERPNKVGPLKDAKESGGMVVFIPRQGDPSNTLAAAITSAWEKRR